MSRYLSVGEAHERFEVTPWKSADGTWKIWDQIEQKVVHKSYTKESAYRKVQKLNRGRNSYTLTNNFDAEDYCYFNPAICGNE
jgi:hypothetical protein